MRRALALILLFAPVVLAGTADDLFRALDLERGAGDHEAALALYRKVAESGGEAEAARARLGAARCLRILGRPEEAIRELDALDGKPLDAELRDAVDRERARLVKPAARSAEEERLAAELEKTKAALQNEEGAREELEKRIADLESRLARLRGEEEQDPRRELEYREMLAAYALDQAQASYREGRFEEALEWTDRALENDPGNADARELRRRLGDAPGGRDHLVREILRVLDHARQLRLDELQAEVSARLSSGGDLLVQGRLDEAAACFRDVIALVDSAPAFFHELAGPRAHAREMLERARVRGGDPAAVPPTRVKPDGRAGVSDEIEELLTRLTAADRPGALRLRVHPVPAPPAATGTDPLPGTFGRAARTPAAAPLLRSLLPVLFRPPAWEDTDQFVRDLGDALVVYAPEEVQLGVSALLRRISARQDPPVRLDAELVVVDPAGLAAAAGKAGVAFSPQSDAAYAVADAKAAAEFRAALLGDGGGESLGVENVTSLSGSPSALALTRRVNLLASRAAPADPELRRLDYGLGVELLPVRVEGDWGLAVRVDTTRLDDTLTLPSGPGSEVQVPAVATATADAAARVPAGSTLVLAGLANPFASGRGAPRSSLVLLVRVGAGTEVAPGKPPAPAPAPAPALPIAVELEKLDVEPPDEPAAPFLGERTRVGASRSGFLTRYLLDLFRKDLEPPDASLLVRPGVVWVYGGETLAARVREAVQGLAATRDRVVTIRVRAAAVSPAEEGRLLARLPTGGRVVEGEGVLTRVLGPDDLDRDGLRYFLAGTEGRIELPDTVLARPTQLVSVSRAVRTPFFRGMKSGPTGETWPDYGAVEEGLSLEFRPLLLPGDRIDLTATARVARVVAKEAEAAPPGKPEAPLQTISVATVRAELTAGSALLVSGLGAPTPVSGRRDRLVVLLTFEADGAAAGGR